MGIVFGIFRKAHSTIDELDKIDKEIKSIEKFKLSTELEHKRIVGQFILMSLGVYVAVVFIFYFFYFPTILKDQVLYVIPLLLVPGIILTVKKLLTRFYKRKISQNEGKLRTLRAEKKKLLEQVMEKETYKTAKTILEKYAPDQLRKSQSDLTITPFKPIVPSQSSAIKLRPSIPMESIPPKPRTPAPTGIPPAPNTNGQNAMTVTRTNVPQLPLPRDIIARDRSVFDKMVEYLVGDGPGNRYALICKGCQSHNGMAMKEEFEYTAFRCCYCYCFNPARKQRPSAPKLDFDIPRTPLRRRLSSENVKIVPPNPFDTDTEKSDSASSDTESTSAKGSPERREVVTEQKDAEEKKDQ